MRIVSFSARDFRNLNEVTLNPGENLNFIVGPNGSGKTNLVEAICYLSVPRSFRMANDAELVHHGCHGFGVQSIVDGFGGETKLEVFYRTVGGKTCRVDGVETDTISEIIGRFLAVSFSPEDVLIVKGSPSLRRRLLDMAISEVSGEYLRALSDYGRVVRQRNSALSSGDEVTPWTERFVSLGSKLLSERVEAVEILAGFASSIMAKVGGEWGDFGLSYRCTAGPLDRGDSLDNLAEKLRASLEESWPREIRYGVTMVGPHRDDLIASLDGRELRRFASQGQSRSAAVALKLSVAEYIRERTGERPVLLMDDVFSELDPMKVERLISVLGEYEQVFITTATRDDRLVPEDVVSKVFEVKNGEVVESGI